MNITLFNRLYWIRRFGVQRNVKGYMVSGHEDFAASLHVHPSGTDTMQALPEGQRKVKRIEGHGMEPLLAADEKTNRKGDMIWYRDDWYECVSSMLYDHTILSHYNYQFVLVPHDASSSIDVEPPVGEPVLPPDHTEEQPDEGQGEHEDVEENPEGGSGMMGGDEP